MNWYKFSKLIPIYRGEYSGNKGGGYFSTDKEFARQFTQSGLDREIIRKTIDSNLIFDSRTEGNTLTSATNEQEFDYALNRAKELGFVGFRLTEGSNQPDSIYIIDRSML